jgi:hypothetical protein
MNYAQTRDEAVIKVRREGGHHVDHRRDYKVVIDGAEVGMLRPGESDTYSVTAGKHDLELKIDWAGSGRRCLDLQPGEIAEFTCSPRVRGRRAEFSRWKLFRYTFIERHQYIDLHTTS